MHRFPAVTAPIVVLCLAAAFAAVLIPSPALTQEPGNVPETKAPPPSAGEIDHQRQLREDWPWLAKFRDADTKLGDPAPGEKRVVFMGDSITEAWKIEGPNGSFRGKPYINRGISGQTAPQMVLRFRQDVIDLKPKVVLILAGPESIEAIEGYLASMAELASANGIKVILCSILPAYDYPWKPGLEPAPKILAINAWLKDYAAKHHHIYLDYHSAMKDQRDGLPANLSKDGVHPLPAGYDLMAPLAEAAIEKALR
jgi:lysophospholipase L1-like esterase